jgi:CxxC motif-containing protein (DUF1111 family)
MRGKKTAGIGVFVAAACSFGQNDPGPRAGTAGAGGFFPGLNAREQAFFNQALSVFQEVDSVSGTIPGESGSGLGPTFNGNSCAMCHAQPAAGGSSPGLNSLQNPAPNPQVALATLHGAANTVPAFITAHGPVREARFIAASNRGNAALDGGVHGLFTIKGRSDAPGCNLAQPDFAAQLANNNVIFRIPTPTFGLGLVEATPDAVLQANLAANASQKAALGISGRLNTSGNDGTVTRFGWKAQNKSLLIFAGEAYNVEQGVSNEAFPNERSAVAGCVFNRSPEDGTNLLDPVAGLSLGTASEMSSDVVNFAMFVRLSAPPVPVTSTPSQLNGQALFGSVGCALCHTPSLTSGPSRFTGMSNQTYHPYSDFALHNMGANLADGINQGTAGPDEFRTAPLWGVGQRLFFLHDGRTSDLLQAIRAHSSGAACEAMTNQNCGSEASQAIQRFNSLKASQQQDILNFLRSL